jgi:hypothetical protein
MHIWHAHPYAVPLSPTRIACWCLWIRHVTRQKCICIYVTKTATAAAAHWHAHPSAVPLPPGLTASRCLCSWLYMILLQQQLHTDMLTCMQCPFLLASLPAGASGSGCRGGCVAIAHDSWKMPGLPALKENLQQTNSAQKCGMRLGW